MFIAECQDTPSRSPCYASGPNDVWSLGIILVNLTCGRNPWKRATMNDSTFRAYRNNPRFLSSILPLSEELNAILGRIFECDPRKRISISELRAFILRCPRFTTRPSRGLPPTPPSEPQYMPETPLTVAPVFPASFDQAPAAPSDPVLPSPEYRVTAQLSSSSKGSSASENGSTFSDTSTLSSRSSCESFEEIPKPEEQGNAPSPPQFTPQYYRNYFPMDLVPGSMIHQQFLSSVQVC